MVEVRSWLAEPLPGDVQKALERLAAQPGVRRIAVMPDVHLADAVCVGTVLATDGVVYPQAVGGDIGCGMATLRLDGVSADDVTVRRADQLFAALRERVPVVRRRERLPLPSSVSLPAGLPQRGCRDAEVQFGTVGRGNHFVELQADEQQRLWLAVHSGSRALGPAVRERHLDGGARSRVSPIGLLGEAACAYLADHDLAVAYAAANRRAIAEQVLLAIADVLGGAGDWSSWFDVRHNFARRESHGAGRCLARGVAMKEVSTRRLLRDLEGVHFERHLADRLRDEAPSADKDIGKVMRAQRGLVRVVRRLRPVWVYKGA